MKLGTHQLSSKKTTLVIAAVLGGALVGSGVTYLAIKGSGSAGSPSIPESGLQEQFKDPFQNQSEASIPSGTISPTTIAAKPAEYAGKELKVRGKVIEVSEGKYLVVGQEKDKPAAINLTLSSPNIDIKPYINGYTDTGNFKPDSQNQAAQTTGAATVTGVLKVDAQGFRLEATKIES